MGNEAVRDQLTDFDGHSIADETSVHLIAHRLAGSKKLVVGRECLESGSFPECDRPVLFWVSEPSVPKAKTLSSNCW